MTRASTLGELVVMELAIVAAGSTLVAAGSLFQRVLILTTRRQSRS